MGHYLGLSFSQNNNLPTVDLCSFGFLMQLWNMTGVFHLSLTVEPTCCGCSSDITLVNVSTKPKCMYVKEPFVRKAHI